MIVAVGLARAVWKFTGFAVPAVIAHTLLRVLVARALAIASQAAYTWTAVTLTELSIVAWVESRRHVRAVTLVINTLAAFTTRVLTVYAVCTVVVTHTQVAGVSAHGGSVARDLASPAHPATLAVGALWDIVGGVAVAPIVAVFGAVGYLAPVTNPPLAADTQPHDGGG